MNTQLTFEAVRVPLPEHGTRQRYMHRSEPCHCRDCRGANTAYIAAYRARLRANTWQPRRWEQLELGGYR